MDISSLSTSLRQKTKLCRQACLSIELWKHFDTSTDKEREAHLRKFHLRFQKLKSAELNSNASVALNDYEEVNLTTQDTLMFAQAHNAGAPKLCFSCNPLPPVSAVHYPLNQVCC